MKKNKASLYLLLFLSLALSTLNSSLVHAQQSASVLDEVSKRYDSYETLQTKFFLQVHGNDGSEYQDEGTLYLDRKNNKYRVVLKDQEIINDAKDTWTILKPEKEIQINEHLESQEGIGPQNMFTFYKSGFKVEKTKQEKLDDGEVLTVVLLSPVDKTRNYKNITIRVNKNKHIHDVEILDKSGTTYIYTIMALYVNHKIPAHRFIFDKGKYPNFEIVDLR